MKNLNPTSFYCYSNNLHDFFDSKGINPIDDEKRYHPKTKQQYWIYKSGEIITTLLEQYKTLKPIHQE